MSRTFRRNGDIPSSGISNIRIRKLVPHSYKRHKGITTVVCKNTDGGIFVKRLNSNTFFK